MIWERLADRRPVSARRHVRWVERQRAHTARVARRTAARQARDPHGYIQGAYTATLLILTLTLLCGFLIVLVNQ